MAILNKIPFSILIFRKERTNFSVTSNGNVYFYYTAESKDALDEKVKKTFNGYKKLMGRDIVLVAKVEL